MSQVFRVETVNVGTRRPQLRNEEKELIECCSFTQKKDIEEICRVLAHILRAPNQVEELRKKWLQIDRIFKNTGLLRLTCPLSQRTEEIIEEKKQQWFNLFLLYHKINHSVLLDVGAERECTRAMTGTKNLQKECLHIQVYPL